LRHELKNGGRLRFLKKGLRLNVKRPKSDVERIEIVAKGLSFDLNRSWVNNQWLGIGLKWFRRNNFERLKKAIKVELEGQRRDRDNLIRIRKVDDIISYRSTAQRQGVKRNGWMSPGSWSHFQRVVIGGCNEESKDGVQIAWQVG
jgi:hypothetical protein